tara:strand:+ start:20562 stop:23054 length:2493 start_codon:yes stop_codon:yes gene_type:complete
MSPLLNRANVSSTYGSRVAALRRQANASSGGGAIPDGEAIIIGGGGQTWTAPAGVTAARVVVIGGGGGASSGAGGGGGGAAMKFYDNLVPGTAYVLDVGIGGGAGTTGSQGGTSRFEGPGQTITATGGYGGAAGNATQTGTTSGGTGSGGDINGTGGFGQPGANDPIGSWNFNQVQSNSIGTNGAGGGGGFGTDNGIAGHGGAGSMYAGGGGGGGSDNYVGGDGGPGGDLAISGYSQRAFGGGGGATDGSHITQPQNRDGSGGGTMGGYGGVYGGNYGEAKDSAQGGAGGNYGSSNGGTGGQGSGQQGGGGGGGSFGGGGAMGRWNGGNYGGSGGGGLVYIKYGTDFDGTNVGAHYPISSTFNGRFDLIYHTFRTDNSTAQVRAPNGIQQGDLLIIMEYGPDVTSSITGNIPSGFTLVASKSQHAAVDQRIHYKVADGSENDVVYTGQVGSNEDMHMFVYRGAVPLTSATENGSNALQEATDTQLNLGVSQYNGYVFQMFTAGCRSSNICYPSGLNPSGGWETKPSLCGKNSNEVESFTWRIDDLTGLPTQSRGMSWTYGSTSRQTALAAALNLDFSPPPSGQALLNSAGNNTTWTCPAGVTSVCVVCVGAGGGWTNSTGNTNITFGGVTLSAGGGLTGNGNNGAGGSSSGGDQNYTGGSGASSSYGAGGGGAAGYSGNGQTGAGGSDMFANTYVTGSGSGAGGGSYTGHQNGDSAGKIRGGGGVGLTGKGADATDWSKGGSGGGDAVSHNGSETYGGGGGTTGQYGTRSGGGGGLCWKNNIPVTPGTTYNAYIGGGGNGGSEIGGGGHGAIRIIWGYNRSFPNNNTADV